MRNISFNINIKLTLHHFNIKTHLIKETSYILFMKLSAGLNQPLAEQIERSTQDSNRQIIFNIKKI